MEYRFIGWCSEGNHDKVWVCMQLAGTWQGDFATVWGRRGTKLRYKIHKGVTEWEMDKLIRSKSNKDYTDISKERLASVYPEFDNDLKGIALWAILTL